MKYIKSVRIFLENRTMDELSKGISFEDFLDKSYYSPWRDYKILYRGMGGDYLEDNIFMTDDLDHAKQYGENVDGILYNEDVLHFDNNTFDEFRYNFLEMLNIDFPENHEEESNLKNKLDDIYGQYFRNGKLTDAMYQSNKNEREVIDFVYDFILGSNTKYRELSMTKNNDFMIPILSYYAKREGYNIISFWGSDYGGSDEFVVNDITKYKTLRGVWEESNGIELIRESKDNKVIAYHGTPNGVFDEFSMDKRGTGADVTSPGDYGKGFYFSSEKEYAIPYATEVSKRRTIENDRPTIYTVELKMGNPFDMRKLSEKRDYVMELWKEYGGVFNIPTEAYDKMYKDLDMTKEDEEFYSEVEGLIGDNYGDWEIGELLNKNGYDSIINYDGMEYIVYDPSQIKIIKVESI